MESKLIAINLQELHMYRNRARSDNPPHVFAMADAAYHAMLHQRRSQCIVISGESGAGLLKRLKNPLFFSDIDFIDLSDVNRQNGHSQFSLKTTSHFGQSNWK